VLIVHRPPGARVQRVCGIARCRSMACSTAYSASQFASQSLAHSVSIVSARSGVQSSVAL